MKNILLVVSAAFTFGLLDAADRVQELAKEVLMKGKNYYEYLGVSEDATNEQIKLAAEEKRKNNRLRMIARDQLNLKSSHAMQKRNKRKDHLIHQEEDIDEIEDVLLNKQERIRYDLNLKLYRASKSRIGKKQF